MPDHLFRELAENVNQVFFFGTPGGPLNYISPAFEELWGFSREKLYQDPSLWKKAVHPDDAATVSAGMEKLSDRKPVEMEYRIIRPDGTQVWVLSRVFPIKPAAGNEFRVVGIAEDITAQKKSEEMLRESEERFRQITENVKEVFWMTDPTKNSMIYISPGYEQIWARTCASLYESPRQWLEAIHPDDRERVLGAIIEKQIRGTYNEIYRISRPDGSIRWIQDRAFPIKNAAGKVYRIVGIAEDITERKEAERSLQESQEQLAQSQKMDAVGRLAGGVAHDMNNALTVILGFGEAVLDDMPEGDPNRESIDQIMQAGKRAGAVMKQLLAFSRRQVLKPVVLDLGDVVSAIGKMLRRLIGEDIELIIQPKSDLWPIKADPTEMEQVLMNLAVNSRDAMPDGGTLTVRTSNVEFKDRSASSPSLAPGFYVMLSVTDTGTGMSEETKARIFEPFFTTKEKGKGTGLGLATVYGIVKRCGGDICVDTELGRGTTFRIYLPRTSEARQQVEESVSKPVSGGKETILLVEDEAAVRNVGTRLLRRYGYTVLAARDAKEGMNVLKKKGKDIDLLITDVVMPGTNGKEFSQQAAAIIPGLKVIYISGYTDDILGSHGILDDSAHFLQKPFSSESLAAIVRKALDSPTHI